MQDNTNVAIKSTKDRVYEWIKFLCTNHKFNQIQDVPIMLTREYVANRYSISIRQVERILKNLEEEGKIYRYKIYNNITIYSLRPLDINHDLFVRIRP